MRKFLSLLIVLFCLSGLRAQYVTIPDPNFVSWLQTNVPSAMNGNQMDTTSLAVTTRTVIELEPTQANPSPLIFSNLSGLKYFKNLIRLTIVNQPNIFNLPYLANTIETLKIIGCGNVTSVSQLPNNLKELNISLPISTLPGFPNGLKSFSISTYNSFTWPQLPLGLESLQCSQSAVNAPQHLPSLPNGLKYLYCSMFQIDSLPQHLPDSLISLSCGMNQIPILPSLPNGLKNLECNWNIFTNLPPLPTGLLTLNCSFSQSLSVLPNLPTSLKSLTLNNSKITNLPLLPDSLNSLDCRNNLLTSLPQLPSNLELLLCSNNQISCIPSLPTSLNYLDISSNTFACLPNYLPIMDATYFTYPLCTPGNTITNPNECERADGIIGNTYFDINTNCQYDTTDTKLKNINLKLYDSNHNFLGQANSYSNGIYNFTQNPSNYFTVLDTVNMPYTAQCTYPGIDTLIQLTSAVPIADNVNFSIKCKPGFDLGIQSVLTGGIVFPGQNHHLKIVAGDMSQWYNLNCAAGISGQLTINISGPVSYITPAANALTPLVVGNSFTYNISDFGTINNLQDFGLIMKTDTTATAGDSICVSVNITLVSGDININNNSYHHCYGVVNSYDPNMKEVYPINIAPEFNDWFTYTIHFQNTGNAPAFNIRLVDTLDTNLDLETFKVINYSHNNTWSINNKVAFFNFQNIQLPDSTSNPEGSKGYIQYKIKPKNNLGVGTKIKNTAYIYFDYNSPIITNTTINEFAQVVSVNEYFKHQTATLYPNPNNGSFTLELNNKEKVSIQLIDITGNIVLSQTIENGKGAIDASNLAAGVYTINIKGNTTVTNKKVVIVK